MSEPVAPDRGPTVTLVLGDVFASDAPYLVAPCSVDGDMVVSVRSAVLRLAVDPPMGPFAPGAVVPVRSRAGATTVLFAMTVRPLSSERSETMDVVREAAGRIGLHALVPGAVVAIPLLGSGAGGLDPADSVRAVITGFRGTASPRSELRIHVLDRAVLELVGPVVEELAAAAGPASRVTAELASALPDDGAPMTTGALVAAVIRALGGPDAGPGLEDLAAAGTSGSLDDHLDEVGRRCPGPGLIGLPELVFGLALDPGVGWPLLREGVVEGILRSGDVHPTSLYASVAWLNESPITQRTWAWDTVLGPVGRDLAEDQPLLALALGAPPEWTATLPAEASHLAFSPDGSRLAALAGGVVYVVGADDRPRRVGPVDGAVVSLGWSRTGILALRLDADAAEIVDVATASVLGRVTGVTSGALSAGLPAWLGGPDGVVRWWGPDRPEPEPIFRAPGPVQVLAADGSGRRGLIVDGEQGRLVSTLAEDLRSAGAVADSPAATIGTLLWPEGPYAVLSLGKLVALAEAGEDDRLTLGRPGQPPMAVVRTEDRPVDALASDLDGHRVAVGSGREVRVWPVTSSRSTSRGIAGYEPDATGGDDLLDAERDALALAGLIASADLRPPLAVGLFGGWGSGKTFVLGRILAQLDDLVGGGDPGYVDTVDVISFNAWHYAETNLWASLVHQVLRRIAPEKRDELPEVRDAQRRAAEARAEATRIATQVQPAAQAVDDARGRLKRQRLVAWVTGGGVLLLALLIGTAILAGWSGRLATIASAGTAVLGIVAGAVVRFRDVRAQASDVREFGRSGMAAAGRFFDRTSAEALRAAAARHDDLLEARRAADTEAVRLAAEAVRIEEQAESDPGAILGRLSSVTEYREQLSLVTRTRERFDEVDAVFARTGRRVVIAIDDLDRCAAEKVVQVLEAVHLLFNFPMFVVLLAVDTHWLDRSLRIKYHQLLGDAGGATPSDYLEKIIQIPVRLVPLDEGLVRRMITGLTGQPVPEATAPRATVPLETAPAAPVRPAPAHPGQSALRGSDHLTTLPPPVSVPLSLTSEQTSAWLRPARRSRRELPAVVLTITEPEAIAMSAVAPLIGTTPRTVKRFVNTYRLLKAWAKDPDEFDHRRGDIGDHEVVAFLLAVVTGQPGTAGRVVAGCRSVPIDGTLDQLVGADPEDGVVRRWLAAHPRYGNAPAHRFAEWVPQVARFSFVTPPG
ncbi:P-loop NTPase fold protein [Cryptosporangium sp. NPDC051539]|uniref:P-loop NTPase fold protein n=1 Tax=Cryptosporangium sp. NPDC051539 TaxID=3363962 RepID=UPI00378E195F